MTNWQTKRSDSAGTETLALKRVVFWDPEESTATRPLAINVLGDNLYFPTIDLTKNVCELVDFYGNTAATYDYAPFGAVTTGTPSGASVPANPFQWSSEVYDDELGLVYYNYRHYSPADGRWISRDPIEEQGGLNLYTICGNRVSTLTDWRGEISSLSACFNTPAMFLCCLEAKIITWGSLTGKYAGKSGSKELIKILERWGGKIVKGGKGSHTKVLMPNGKTVIVPVNPANGTVKSILKTATSK